MTVRTRFAPSPTGMLHIGGARAALFNLLFARHHGGEYCLRIEDTDRERSTPAATQAILDGLAWLGLSPDQPPVFQFARQPRHAKVALQMLESGHAYRCYCTAEELREMREQAVAEGRPPRYDGRWRDRDPEEGRRLNIPPAIRLKAPREGETVVDDLVQGTVRVANAELDDMIILRSDGTPTYLHAVVVDDHDMAITHVIRGDDHLTNSFRQLADFRHAMGWDSAGLFAHIPLIHGPDGAKYCPSATARSERAGFPPRSGFCRKRLCRLPAAARLGSWRRRDHGPGRRRSACSIWTGWAASASRMDYAKLTQSEWRLAGALRTMTIV